MELQKAGVYLLALVLGVMVNVEAKNLKPAKTYFSLCSRSDSKALSECLKKSFMDMKPTLVKGVAGLGLVPMDPMNIPMMELQEGSGNFGLRILTRNLTINGLGVYTIYSVNAVLDNKTFDLSLQSTVPEFHMTSEYDMKGRILVIPIRGVGTVVFNTGKMDSTFTLKGHVVKRDNDDWIEIDDIKLVIDLKGKASFHLSNLFNGDKRLGDFTNKFLNENYREMFDAYKHMPEGAMSELLLDYTKKVFNAYPVNQLFLD